MGMKLPNAIQGSANYIGRFNLPIFRIMARPAPLFEALFERLVKYGVRVEDLKVENQLTSNYSVGFDSLLPSNFSVRVRLDSLQVTLHALETIGVENAKQLVMDCWAAMQNTESSAVPLAHNVTTAFQFNLSADEYKNVLESYVVLPKGLPTQTMAGIAYYMPSGSYDGYLGGSIVLDRLANGFLNLRISIDVDAKKVSIETLGDYVEKHVYGVIDSLGLEIQQAN